MVRNREVDLLEMSKDSNWGEESRKWEREGTG